MKIQINLDFIPSLNRVTKFFIFSDLLLLFGLGLMDPIFAVFLIEGVNGATLISIGFLSTIYWTVKGILQVPIALFLDKTDGEKDDFSAIIFGLMISSVASFSLMLVTQMWQVYLIQIVKAFGFAMYVPAWSAIFSRHLDKDHTAYDWAVQSTSIGFGIGIAGAVGGTVASYVGFKFVFLLVGLLSLASAGLLLFIPNLILPRKTSSETKIVGGPGLPH